MRDDLFLYDLPISPVKIMLLIDYIHIFSKQNKQRTTNDENESGFKCEE
jgi:hypothetical protein